MADKTDHDDIVLQAALAEEEEEKATEAAKAEKAKSEKGKDEKQSDSENADAPEQKDDSQKAETTPESDDQGESQDDKAGADDTEADDKSEKTEAKGEEQPDDKAKADKSTETEKQTRREKRQARRQSFLESIREGQLPPSRLPQKRYQPVDYNQLPDDEEIPREALAQDRENYAADQFAAGAELERQTQIQERFWDRYENQAEKLINDPKFSYLDQDSDNFNEERAGRVNELFLIAAGYRETPQYNRDGSPRVDPNTGQQVVAITVDRPDLSFEKFAREYQADIDSQLEEAKAEAVKNISKQKAQSGVRPSGTRQSGQKTFSPGEISRMSPEEFEENREAIEAQEQAAVAALDL